MSLTSNKKSAEILSMSGSPIYQHGEATPWSAPAGEEFIAEIAAHIEKHLGPVDFVFHEIVSDTVHIDIHVVKPTLDFPYTRLVTSGMSDLPMSTPEGIDVPRFAELLITLPANWKTDQASFADEAWYWPIRLLKGLARLPHKHATWLGFAHTVPNGDPAEAYAPNTELCGAILLPPACTDFQVLDIAGVKSINFYAVLPLYASEMDFKLRSGSNKLLERLDRKGISEIVDIARPDVTSKRFWLW
ncbi:suppressor of fused domain protein [Undibacterium sp. Ren11W]|uniref:suppressor of fused domain protein n=1 Tax=Undibacterium sp. Ren11W TaxID=3413045 RepID=UPI003BF4527B